jgi:hypothetical protein
MNGTAIEWMTCGGDGQAALFAVKTAGGSAGGSANIFAGGSANIF